MYNNLLYMKHRPLSAAPTDEHSAVSGVHAKPGDERIVAMLQRCEAFASVPAEQLAAISRDCSHLRVDRRKKLLRVGDKPALMGLLTGRVRVLRRTVQKRDMTLHYAGAGELVGEHVMTCGELDVEMLALERTEVVRIPSQVAQELFRGSPAFAEPIFRLMSERRRAAERRLEAVLSQTVEARVAAFVMEIADRHGQPDSRGTLVTVPFTHQEIADYVGSTRETVTLVLGDFKRNNVLAFDRRRIIVTAPAELKKRAEG